MYRTLIALVAGSATSLLLLGSATAADLPVKAAPPPMIANSWTGFYVGGNAGYGWSDPQSVVLTERDSSGVYESGTWPGFGTFGSLRSRGFFGGAQFGHNWQTGQLVVGFEVDLQISGIKGSTSSTQPYIEPGQTISVATSGSLDGFATIRGRIGYAFDRMLVYGTGGLAIGRLKHQLHMTDTYSYDAHATSREVAAGWVAGGGVEYMIDSRWSVKAEYQYLHFGSTTLSAQEFTGGAGSEYWVYLDPLKSQFHTVRLGLNYRFAPSP